MPSSSQNSAVNVLNNAGVIAHQTDTVFGLACLPLTQSLLRLANIKSRDEQKSFILLAASAEQVEEFLLADNNTLDLLNKPTATPTTWLVHANKNVPSQLLGSTNKVAVRITKHSPIMDLCIEVGAIASTSANISNQPNCINAQQVRAVFGPNIDYIDQNQTPGSGKSSTIIDLDSGNILRR
ncbi:MAG: L-threonylcarbamoyladenylate synthase [Gammaproteobacteria bacterium]